MKEVPSNIDAERAVLGSILIDPDAILCVERDLAPEDFYREAHTWIYGAMLDLHHDHRALDFVTVTDELDQRGQLSKIGGPSEITALIDAPPTSVNVADYVHIVRRTAYQRRIIQASGKIARVAHQGEGDLDSMSMECQRLLTAALPKAQLKSHLTGDDALVAYEANQGRRAEKLQEDPNLWVKTGWADVDEFLSPIEPGIVSIWAGIPGVGKTIALENIAEYNAQRGKNVVFYHYELSHQVMLDRRMSRHSGVDYKELRKGYLGSEVQSATSRMSRWQYRMIYVHCPGWSAEKLVADLTRLWGEGKADLGVIDYLQKMPLPDTKGFNEASLIGQVVETIKTAAEVLGIPLLLGCQVTRAHSQRYDRKPHLSDLRKSGEIEEKCNQVVFLFREAMINDDVKTDVLEVYAEKNTLGPCEQAHLLHQAGRFRFDSLVRRAEP